MLARIGLGAGAAILIAAALWHPVPHAAPLTASVAAATAWPAVPSGSGRHRRDRGSPRGSAGATAGEVYVVGAVVHPGLYRINAGERVDAAVKRAGGLTAEADPAGVNLAAYASDGDEIAVPAAGQTPLRSNSRHRRSHRSKTQAQAAVVDVNAADAAALAAIPGIGPAIAQRIVEMRERAGAYASLDELLDVGGMTATRLERARPYLQAL